MSTQARLLLALVALLAGIGAAAAAIALLIATIT
jgi:hypothetical protein